MGAIPKTQKAKERYDRILEAGLELFLENDYEGVMLSEVIEKSGGSLSTIYSYFENKDGFFVATIQKGVATFTNELYEKMKIDENLGLEEYLREFGMIYNQIVFRPKIIKFHKLILSQGFRGDIATYGKFFLENGITGKNKILESYLKKHKDKFKSEIHACDELVAQYCFLLREPYFYNAIFFNKSPNLSQKAVKTRVNRAIDSFLYGNFKQI